MIIYIPICSEYLICRELAKPTKPHKAAAWKHTRNLNNFLMVEKTQMKHTSFHNKLKLWYDK